MILELEVYAHTICQAIVSLVSVMGVAFYVNQLPNVGWENIWVQSVEAIVYAVSTFGFGSIVVEPNIHCQWVRYVGWLLTCPILLCQLSGLPKHKSFQGQSVRHTVILLLADQTMILSGVTAVFTSSPWKWVFFSVGVVSGFVCVYILFHTLRAAAQVYPHEVKYALLKMTAVYFAAWISFPIFFILGEEGLGLISLHTSLLLHTFADLVAKNLFGYMSYCFHWKCLPAYLHDEDDLGPIGESVTTFSQPVKQVTPPTSAATTPRRASRPYIQTVLPPMDPREQEQFC